MGKKLKCPNCGGYVANHPEDGCILGAMIQAVRDRDVMPERRLRALHASTNVDRLWDRIGPILDDLEEGAFCLESD